MTTDLSAVYAQTDRVSPFFVYGTLRPGQALEYWLTGLVAEQTIGTVEGHTLFTQAKGRSYPYLVATSAPGVHVVGSLMLLRHGRTLGSLIDMEVGAGYHLDTVTVNVEDQQVPAFAFVWRRGTHGLAPVGNPDWTKRDGVDDPQFLTRRGSRA